jgi:hypothetical protein
MVPMPPCLGTNFCVSWLRRQCPSLSLPQITNVISGPNFSVPMLSLAHDAKWDHAVVHES